jgi:hypothetical protein
MAEMKPQALQISSADNEFGAWSAFGAASGEGADHCSRGGALELKQKIEAYWRERGQEVMIVLHNVGFHPAIRAARFDVRSDMVNGLPRPRRERPSGAPAEVFVEDFDQSDEDLAYE